MQAPKARGGHRTAPRRPAGAELPGSVVALQALRLQRPLQPQQDRGPASGPSSGQGTQAVGRPGRRIATRTIQRGHLYLGRKGTFLLWVDIMHVAHAWAQGGGCGRAARLWRAKAAGWSAALMSIFEGLAAQGPRMHPLLRYADHPASLAGTCVGLRSHVRQRGRRIGPTGCPAQRSKGCIRGPCEARPSKKDMSAADHPAALARHNCPLARHNLAAQPRRAAAQLNPAAAARKTPAGAAPAAGWPPRCASARARAHRASAAPP